MKKLFITLTALLLLIACKKDYVTLSGNIDNAISQELKIINNRNEVIKTITLNDDNSFTDTLKVTKGVYSMTDGNEFATLFLENGYDISISLDTKEFDETLTFSGNGSDASNYLVKKTLLQEETFDNINDLYALEKEVFISSLEDKKNEFVNLRDNYKNLDSTLYAEDLKDTEMLFKFFLPDNMIKHLKWQN